MSNRSPWKIFCVIPVYNNAATIKDVALRCAKLELDGVLVVDDGSTDADLTELLRDLPCVTLIRHERNRGKGRALMTAMKYLSAQNVDYMITLDGDGQHYPEDIDAVLPFIADNDYTMVVGTRDFENSNAPEKSRFGRRFSNFWMYLETGQRVGDAQSGFRVYPVKYISRLRFLCSHYNFETEVLVKAAWAGIPIISVPIRVWYPENDSERVSSFRPFMDNVRISLINTHLVGLRVLPLPRRKLVKSESNREEMLATLKNPWRLMRELLKENATPGGLAVAAGVGAFLAVLPIPGFHSVVILYAASRLHLNKIMAFNIQHLFMPPLTPFLCLEVGHYLRYGKWFTELSFDTLVRELGSRVFEWWLGALVLALPLAMISAAAVYGCALGIRRWRHGKA